MQLDKFTIKATEALNEAQRIATSKNALEMYPVHLIHEVFQQKEGVGAMLLEHLQIDISQIQKVLKEKMQEVPTHMNESKQELRPSQDLLKLLKEANTLAKQRGDEYISTEHFILAYLKDKKGATNLENPWFKL